jgi:hypothetical protein
MTIHNCDNPADTLIMPGTKPKHLHPSPLNAPPPTNVNEFSSDGWLMTTHPMKCFVPDQIGDTIGYKHYCFESERVLCTQAFSVAAVSPTINDSEFPLRSTELDKETGHNCKMTKEQYRTFTQLVLGLDDETWAKYCTKSAFCNMILQNLDVMLYYFKIDWHVNAMPISPPGD